MPICTAVPTSKASCGRVDSNSSMYLYILFDHTESGTAGGFVGLRDTGSSSATFEWKEYLARKWVDIDGDSTGQTLLISTEGYYCFV